MTSGACVCTKCHHSSQRLHLQSVANTFILWQNAHSLVKTEATPYRCAWFFKWSYCVMIALHGFCSIFPVETGRWYPVQQVLLLGSPPLGFLSADWLSPGLSRSKQLSNMFCFVLEKNFSCRPEIDSCCILDFSVSFEITLFDRVNMRFVILEPDGRGNEFVLTGDKLGQDVLDKVKALMIWTSWSLLIWPDVFFDYGHVQFHC